MVNLVELAENGVEWARDYIKFSCMKHTYRVSQTDYVNLFGTKSQPSPKGLEELRKAEKVLCSFDYLFDLPSDGEIENPGNFDELAKVAIAGLIPPQEALLRLDKAFQISGKYKYYTIVDFYYGSPNEPSGFGQAPYRNYIVYNDSEDRLIAIHKKIVSETGVNTEGAIHAHLKLLDDTARKEYLDALLMANSFGDNGLGEY